MEILAETNTFYSSSDNDNLSTIEETLYTILQRKCFTTTDPSLDNTALGVKEVALEERGGLIGPTCKPLAKLWAIRKLSASSSLACNSL
jgi:hypothetical protein